MDTDVLFRLLEEHLKISQRRMPGAKISGGVLQRFKDPTLGCWGAKNGIFFLSFPYVCPEP
eukprot:COSAG06_NODE_25892_length_626_cov_1.322581_2_plen_60_part_01